GGINPADFASNPLIVGSPAPPVDASITGTEAQDQESPAADITPSTLLSGASGSDSIASSFAAGDTITVDGTAITFVNSGATGNELNVNDNVQALLNKISSITGGAATLTGGQITLHTGTFQNLKITSSNTAAFAALGFDPSGTITQAMGTG